MGVLGLGLMFGMGGDSDNDDEPSDIVNDTDDDPIVPVTAINPAPVSNFVYDGSPTLTGKDGDDTLVQLDSTPENETLMALTRVIDGDGDDTLLSNGVGPEFNGGDGNDLIDVATNDTVNGGTGNDTNSSAGGAVVHGGTGDDVLNGQHGDTHFGGAGNDALSGASSMSGGDGNDTI